MSEPLWSDDRIADYLQNHSAYFNSAFFSHEQLVAYGDAFNVTAQVRDEMQARIDALEANADPELLTIAYGKGRADEQERSRKRIAELEVQLAQCTSTYKEVALVVLEEDARKDRRITELEAALAAASQWQPVEADTHIDCTVNHKYGVFLAVHEQSTIEAYDPAGDTVEQVFVFLPDNVRLCRRTPAAGE